MVQKRKIWLPFWLILGLFFAFFLRLPSLFEPYSYGDECIYLTLGQAARQGLVLYRQIHDNKPPLLYLLAAASGSLFWFRAILLFWGLATIFLFYKLAQIFFQKKEKLLKISTLSFAIFSSIPLFEGGVANAEVFMIGLTISALILLFPRKNPSPKIYLVAGILFSLATLFKVPAIFDFLAVLVFLLIVTQKTNYKLSFGKFRTLRQRTLSEVEVLITNYFLLALGFLLPILASLVYFWSQNALNQYLTAAFFQNLPYLSSWGGGSPGPLSPGLLVRFAILVTFFALLWWKRKEINFFILFVFLWFAFSLFGATLSGRPYPHYLVQVLPSLCLLLAFFFSKQKPKEYLFLSASLAVFLLALFHFRFWVYSPFSPYKNFFLFVSRKWSQEKYFSSFGEKVLRNYKLGEFIVTSLKPQERVFVWGDSPCVYALSHHLPPVRYTASYHIVDFGGYQETVSAIEKEKPRFIIDLQDEKRPFPGLYRLLSQKYSLFKKEDGAEIFRLKLDRKWGGW
ncbi:MAG: ArnT family glycosyltransferase [Patescibacteria group bacterium]